MAQRNGSVLAVSNDFFQSRYPRKNGTVGIIVRDGEILSDKTKAENWRGFPNLDTLALFPDGELRVFNSKEHTGAEYLAMGATDVMAFGPWLVRDGEINPKVYTYSKIGQPRTAIGMVERGHYFAMLL